MTLTWEMLGFNSKLVFKARDLWKHSDPRRRSRATSRRLCTCMSCHVQAHTSNPLGLNTKKGSARIDVG
jgi:hypothetical protein